MNKPRIIAFLVVIVSLQMWLPASLFGQEDKVPVVMDYAQVYSMEQLEDIARLCWEIKHDHSLEVYVWVFDDPEEHPSIGALGHHGVRRVVIMVDQQSKTVAVATTGGLDAIRKMYFDRVAYQWIEKNMVDDRHFEGTMGALREIKLQYSREARLREIFQKQDEELFMPNTRNVLIALLTLFIVFLIYQSIQGSRKGNYYENTQDYGISRMSMKTAVLTGIVLAILSILFLNQYIFYYDELTMVFVAMAFAFWPLLLIACRVVMFFVDLMKILKPLESDGRYSLAQKSLLINRKSTGELLLELNFYELIIRKGIILQFEEINHPSRLQIKIGVIKSPQVEADRLPADQIPLIEAFTEDEMNLEDYLHSLYKQALSFKAYKKDRVALELVKKGHLSRYSWLFNLFPTDGAKQKNKIKAMIEKIDPLLNQLANERTEGRDKLADDLNDEALLVKDFERKIDAVFNNFATGGDISVLEESRLGPIFHQNFSFDQFNRKMANSYKSTGKSWDWMEDDY